MTAGAWWMLGLTWAVVTYFAGRFFWRVATLPGGALRGPASGGGRRRGEAPEPRRSPAGPPGPEA